MDVLGQSALLVAIVSFGLGFSVLARNVKNKLFLLFALLTTVTSGWALFFFLAKVWDKPGFYRWHLLLNIWLAPAALAFIRTFVRITDRWSRTLLAVSLAGATILSGLLAFHYERVPVILQIMYFFPGVVVLQLLQLMWNDQRLAQRPFKAPTVGLDRRNLIYLGGLVVLATCVMDHVPWLGIEVPSLGNLALTVYLFFIAQAISRQRLLNFGALFSRFLVLLAIAFTLTLVYSMLFAWIENRPALFFLNSFIVSFLLLMLLEPIRSLVSYLTHRLLTQKYLRLEQTLREAQRRLVGITDPSSLFQAILETAEQTLQPEWGALFVLRSDGTRYRRARVFTREDQPVEIGSNAELKELLSANPLLEYCRQLQARGDLPVLLDQVLESEIDRSASRKQREFYASLIQGLRALGANLLIPLFDGDRILGFVILRADAPPEPWGNNWGLLPVIYPYFEQSARAMQNLAIYVRQREKERLAALGEMAAGLAHEIRNPLGAIKGAAQFLENASHEKRPESRFLQVILEEVDRLNHVVTQFLDYSKPPTTEFVSVSLVPLVEKTVELMRPSLPDGVQLSFEASPETRRKDLRVMSAHGQLQQVLINLIQNSSKAVENSPNKKIRISVEANDGSEVPEAIVSIEDTGHGIKRENLDKLFIPFFTTSPSGTGLGLSISQKIIEAHRGRVEVASEEGRFTRFSVILPWVTGG